MAVGVRAGAAIAGLAFLTGCQLILDFSPIADGGGGDGSAIDGGGPDAETACGVLEPNESLGTPALADPGTFVAAICPAGDQDFYGFDLSGSEDLVIELTFEAGVNDLELELYDATSGDVLTLSTGGDGDEKIEHSAANSNRLGAGTYAMRVFGRDLQVQNEYQLMWRRGFALPVDAGAAP